MSDPDGRVRLTILGGFLGSGKTTWLRHQLHAGAFAGAFVVSASAAFVVVRVAIRYPFRARAELAIPGIPKTLVKSPTSDGDPTGS